MIAPHLTRMSRSTLVSSTRSTALRRLTREGLAACLSLTMLVVCACSAACRDPKSGPAEARTPLASPKNADDADASLAPTRQTADSGAQAPRLVRLPGSPLFKLLAGLDRVEVRAHPRGAGAWGLPVASLSLKTPDELRALRAALGDEQPESSTCPRCRPAFSLFLEGASSRGGRLEALCADPPDAPALLRDPLGGRCWRVQRPEALHHLLKSAAPAEERSVQRGVGANDLSRLITSLNGFAFRLFSASRGARGGDILIAPLPLVRGLAALQGELDEANALTLRGRVGLNLAPARLAGALGVLGAAHARRLEAETRWWSPPRPARHQGDSALNAEKRRNMEAAWLVKGVSWPEDENLERLERVLPPERWVIDAAKLSRAPKSPTWRPVAQREEPPGVERTPSQRPPSVLAAAASFDALKIAPHATEAAQVGGAGGVSDLGSGRWRVVGRFAAVEMGGWRVVWLPVEGGELEVVLFSPVRAGQLGVLLAGLNQVLVRSAHQAAVFRPLDLKTPALNLEMIAELREELTVLGLGALFDRQQTPESLNASLAGASIRWEAPPQASKEALGETPAGVERWDMTRPTVIIVQSSKLGAVLALGLMRGAAP